jgi:Family of unknown function (DUF6011)
MEGVAIAVDEGGGWGWQVIPDGGFSIIYSTGQYRTLRVRTANKGDLVGKRILSLKEGDDWKPCAFLSPQDRASFWRAFRADNDAVRLARIQRAVDIVSKDPSKGAMAFAMCEKKCSRCGRDLTVPASLYRGMGPECAGKGHWSQEDQRAVFSAMQEAQERLGLKSAGAD